MDENENIAIDEEEVADDSDIDEEEVAVDAGNYEKEIVELDDDEYEDMITETPTVDEEVLEIVKVA